MSQLTDKHAVVRHEEGFRHTVQVREHEFVVDEPRHLGGSDTAASPLELLAAALGSCTASTVEMYAARNQWPLTGVEAEVDFKPPRSGQPGRFDVTLRLGPGLTP